MLKKYLVLVLCFIAFSSMKADAKWWIFGQGNDEVNINYLYINKNSYDELGNNVIIYKDSLQNGLITVNGRASVKKGEIGAVLVSKDNRETWEKAKLNENGTFQYSFIPEIAKDYNFYIKIIDTAGKNNNVESTYKKITVIDENISALIRETLDKIIKTYENEEENLFMSYVSPNFAGDQAVLDSAVRRDFNSFDYIKLNCYINNISKAPDGRVFVSIQYNRTVISTRSGRTFSDRGNTEVVFKNEEGKFKLFSMKNPLMFGLSDAGNVATGTIQSATNEPIILVDESGNVDEKPFIEAITIIEGNSDSSNDTDPGIPARTATLHAPPPGAMESGDTLDIANGIKNGGTKSIQLGYNIIYTIDAGTSVKELVGISDIEDVTEVPASITDVNIPSLGGPLSEGIYALLLSNGKYAVLQIDSVEQNIATGCTTVIRYKYQPDGSRNF